MQTAGITGASGFIGKALCKTFAENNWKVKGLDITPPDKREKYTDDFLKGSVLSPSSLDNLTKGCDVVIHLAALVRDWKDNGLTFRVNVEGTKNVIQSCFRNNVKRFIFYSSVAVHRYRNFSKKVDERAPFDAKFPPYALSKIEGEKMVRNAGEKGMFEWTIIRPGFFPFGPGDFRVTYKFLKIMEKGFLPLIKGGKNLISTSYVENLARGTYLATVKDKAKGQTFLLSDPWLISWRRLFEMLSKEMNKKVRFLSFPALPIYPFSVLLELLWRVKPSAEPPLTRYRIKSASLNLIFCSDKAEKLLGFTPPVELEEAVQKTVEWYKRVRANKQ